MNKSGIRISIPKELQEFCNIRYWYDNARRDYILEFVCVDRDMTIFPKYKDKNGDTIRTVCITELIKMYKEKLKKEKRRNNENKKR